MTEEIVWSYDEENFRYDSKYEAIGMMDEPEPGMIIYYGTPNKPSPREFVTADYYVEQMQEMAYDNYGEWAEDFGTDASNKSVKELQRLIEDWAEKNMGVSFYTVKDVKEYTITEEDIKEIE